MDVLHCKWPRKKEREREREREREVQRDNKWLTCVLFISDFDVFVGMIISWQCCEEEYFVCMHSTSKTSYGKVQIN
jgi:hypothetical protein